MFYFHVLTDDLETGSSLTSGTYELEVVATDRCGSAATATVTVTVTDVVCISVK